MKLQQMVIIIHLLLRQEIIRQCPRVKFIDSRLHCLTLTAIPVVLPKSNLICLSGHSLLRICVTSSSIVVDRRRSSSIVDINYYVLCCWSKYGKARGCMALQWSYCCCYCRISLHGSALLLTGLTYVTTWSTGQCTRSSCLPAGLLPMQPDLRFFSSHFQQQHLRCFSSHFSACYKSRPPP